ncbi:MAG: hypothetical protein U0228_33315 [Myxococcaceae bacterium]
MSELEEHLRASDDPASWLVYGDLLASEHDARAELIRLEVELAQTVVDGPRRRRLHGEIQHLLKRHRADWLGELAEGFENSEQRLELRHGFVTGVRLVRQRASLDAVLRFLSTRNARFVTSVGFSPRWAPEPDEGVVEAFCATSVPTLRSFSLAYGALPEVSVLRAAPWLRQLTRLDLRYTQLGDGRLRALFLEETWPRLEELLLQHDALTDAGVDSLVKARFPALRVLDVRRNPVRRPRRWTFGDAQAAATTRAARFGAPALELDEAAFARLHDEPAHVRRQWLEGLRDAALSRSGDEALVRRCADLVDEPPTLRADGLDVCFHPTRRFKALRFFDVKDFPEAVRRLFARPVEHGVRDVVAGFVDPTELSFRSYENIVSLDRHLGVQPLALRTGPVKRWAEGEVFTFPVEADAGTRAQLERLDELGLYVPPFSAGSRGGERFIFHCAALAESLKRVVEDVLPPESRRGFVHVNPVFRCNRFEPGDEKFHQHTDTPYFDPNRRHVSKLTLLLYLTGGTGEPALSMEGVDVLTRVEPMTGVLFDQRYAHEGRPFVDGRKVFLRTELIFEATQAEHDEGIAAAFAKATYLTGETVFRPELAAYASRLYEAAARAHWDGLRAVPESPFLGKRFRGTAFVSNGYDFWFSPSVPLEECAALALLDVLNVQLDGAPFRRACVSDVLPAGVTPGAWLEQHRDDVRKPLPVARWEHWLPPLEEPVTCCPTHTGERFDPFLSDDVIDLAARGQRWVRARLESAPVVMLGQRVWLNPARFKVGADRIDVLSADALKPVNFAACWNSGGPGSEDHVGVATELRALHPLVPPLWWAREDGLVHLRFDLFRNGWCVSHRVEAVPVPRVLERDEAVDGEAPWVHAVAPLMKGRPGVRPRGAPYGIPGHVAQELWED